MNITEAQVKNWYQNRRSRWKNENVNNVINFTAIQLEGLEWEFKKNPRIDEQERIKLGNTLNLSESQVKSWFQNRRSKQKREDMLSRDLNQVQRVFFFLLLRFLL